ncbi:hypothetical protein PsorP6_008049 [Peronosclerospora sorghi]|uniref:Uncharacterized protein n=1 Tax=Peronosclerospora sorghi TaxID=230839 RepID=A0ACC0WAD2_9STRA|nr:hypothetical protein PsorP6_008049 [Peronosclerospora sorghi]
MVEPLYVHVDEAKGLQKLSYYGGTDVYIYNTSGASYEIVPVIRKRKCFKSGSNSLQHIFPNLTLFEPDHGVLLVQGRPCFSWKFITQPHEPTSDGLLGEYTLYVDQKTERPDQGACGSCWTFGTTGALEGQLFAQQKKLFNMSQQNLLDCSWDFGNNACDGGLDYQAYEWIMANGGLETTATYGSYRNAPGYCHFTASNAIGRMEGFVNVTSVEALNDALATVGPLSVSIDATLPSFYFYGGGYYDDVECKSDLDSLDHSVLAVGVTSHNGQKYTLVKNSWSTHWGEKGYIKIAQKDNLCGVATAATYPVLAD